MSYYKYVSNDKKYGEKTKKYEKNYLTQVIFKINFSLCDEIDESSLKTFKDALGDEYGTLSNVVQQGIVIQNDPTGIVTQKNSHTIWRIDCPSQSHLVEIEKESLAVIYTSYSNFEAFKETVEKVLDAFFGIYSSVTAIQRLGLRYINQIGIKDNDLKWTKYINDKLVNHLEFSDSNKIRRSMHTMFLSHDEDTGINFNFGIFNQYFPAPIVDNEFIIDIDAFTPAVIDKDLIKQTLAKFNDVITEYFEQSIKDDLREVMGVKT